MSYQYCQSVRIVSLRNNFYLQEAEEECIDGYSVNREAGVGDVIRAEYDEQNGKNVEMNLQSRVIERNRKADWSNADDEYFAE